MPITTTPFNSKQYLQDLITSFTLKLISSGVCVWDNLQESSLDTWQAQQAKNPDDETILILQFSTSSIRRFIEGIEFNSTRISPQFAESIISNTDEIRLELNDYIRSTAKSVNVELWVYELITVLSDLSGYIQNLLRKRQEQAVNK
jgi:hypothetical protein